MNDMANLGNPLTVLRTAATTALVSTSLVVAAHPAGAAVLEHRCHGHRATIVGTPGPDHLVGTHGKDVIVALGGDDVVSGRGGHDVVCAGDGNDHVDATSDHRGVFFGGPGADLVLAAHGSKVYAGPGRDAVVVGHAVTSRLSVNGGAGRNTVTFHLPGGGASTTLHTNLATATGRMRSATFTVHDFGKVQAQAGQRGDHWTVRGTRAAEYFVALKGPASLRATVRAAGGDDHVHTRGGRDRVRGGPGDDTANTGAGIDSCSGVEVTRGCESVSS